VFITATVAEVYIKSTSHSSCTEAAENSGAMYE